MLLVLWLPSGPSKEFYHSFKGLCKAQTFKDLTFNNFRFKVLRNDDSKRCIYYFCKA